MIYIISVEYEKLIRASGSSTLIYSIYSFAAPVQNLSPIPTA
ncbi:MAG: hypothetical protein QNJ60_13555 [Xenococcaceae cyanobacterium MO_188.B19]|nr:hypothetical protein [Xenococcaceae cyanobacterium MO_188.B19]